MIKKETKIKNLSSIKHFRILVVGSKKSGKNILIERMIHNGKHKIKRKINSDVQFGLFEKNNEKIIVEFYDNFHYQLDAKSRIKFLERCNLAIVVGNISEAEFGETINTIEDFEFDLGKLFPWFIPFRTLIVRTKVHANEMLFENFSEEPCLNNSYFVDLSRNESESNNELILLIHDVLTQITKALDSSLIENINSKLKSDDKKEQQLAIHMVGKHQLKQFNEEIIKLAFSQESEIIKCAAIWALGQLGLTNYTNKLIELFQMSNSNDNEVKSEIMIALLKLLDPSRKEFIEEIKATSSNLSRVNIVPFEILLHERQELGT